MGAIRVHHTATSDSPWDAKEAVRRLRNDGNEQYYRQAFAWQDPGADPETKSAYKFSHHEVSENGQIGAANIRACRAAIAVLNGARGGADIPDSDRPGVYAHAAAHLRDAGFEPPELKASAGIVERRCLGTTRAEPVGGRKPKLVGYAAVFNSWYESRGLRYRERVLPGAFARTIQEADVRALWNHNPDKVLGRTSNGTLELREDDHGLWFEITPVDAVWARDVIKSIQRGDVTQMSFGFRAVKDVWRANGSWEERDLVEVELLDVSPVTFPAYEETQVQIRSLLSSRRAEEQPELPADERSSSGAPAKKSLVVMRRKLDLAETAVNRVRRRNG